MGITDGKNTFGLGTGIQSLSVTGLSLRNYGINVGTENSAFAIPNPMYTSLGVTQDPTKSGLIATFSGLTIGTVASEKLGNFYIRY